MNLEQLKTKYVMDAKVTPRENRKFQIFLRGQKTPFFSSENESRFLEQIKHLDKLSDDGKGTPYEAYKDGKLYKRLTGIVNAINKDYSKKIDYQRSRQRNR